MVEGITAVTIVAVDSLLSVSEEEKTVVCELVEILRNVSTETRLGVHNWCLVCSFAALQLLGIGVTDHPMKGCSINLIQKNPTGCIKWKRKYLTPVHLEKIPFDCESRTNDLTTESSVFSQTNPSPVTPRSIESTWPRRSSCGEFP